MNTLNLRAFLALFSIVSVSAANAYDTETHALITRQAFARSSVAQSDTFVKTLGLNRLDTENPFGPYWLQYPASLYFADGGSRGWTPQDASGSTSAWTQFLGWGEDFERCQMNEFLNINITGINDPRKQFKDLFGDTVTQTSVSSVSSYRDPVLPLQNWLVRGAIREDDMGAVTGLYVDGSHCGHQWLLTSQHPYIARSLNHFYDPWVGQGLNALGNHGEKSVDWALGYFDSFIVPPVADTTTQNFYTYVVARNSFYAALTRENNRKSGSPYTTADREADAEDRMYSWATAFRSLGNVLHLLEDTGQPQHTRNDPHGAYVSSHEQQAFEGYTNARVLGFGSVNDYVQSFFPRGFVPSLSAPPLGSYPAVSFAVPQHYFSSWDVSSSALGRFGLADYTNRGFFTGGTLPDMPGDAAYSFPPKPLVGSDGNPVNGYTKIEKKCALSELISGESFGTLVCGHFTHAVPDDISPSYPDVLPLGFSEPPLAAESVFAQIIEGEHLAGITHATAMGIEELDTIANLSIPRAVGYATGMLNFFFRGVGGIEVTPPSSGVYAIVDHGQPHEVNSDGYVCDGSSASDGCPIFGFKHVQLTIKNKIPPLVDMGLGRIINEDLTKGAIVAVARYHRNKCYKPDLSGEPSGDMNQLATATSSSDVDVISPSCPAGTDYFSSRSQQPEISVSSPIAVTDDGSAIAADGQQKNVNGGASVQLDFDFSGDPIPVNATDLFMEVVFRGRLGDTSDPGNYESDAIAVGSVDVSEPTYGTFMNLTPFFYAYGTSFAPYTGWSEPYQADANSSLYPVPIFSISVCLDNYLLMSTPSDGIGLMPGSVVRLAAILDPSVPTTRNLAVSYQNSFGAVNWQMLGSAATWKNQSPPGAPNFSQYNQFNARLAQAPKENATLGRMQTSLIASGDGINLGDNFYASFWHVWGDGQPSTPLTPLFPTKHLPGVDAGIRATSASQTYLNNSSAPICQ